MRRRKKLEFMVLSDLQEHGPSKACAVAKRLDRDGVDYISVNEIAQVLMTLRRRGVVKSRKIIEGRIWRVKSGVKKLIKPHFPEV